jgi:hypothetical protein
MGQELHECARTTAAVRRAIQLPFSQQAEVVNLPLAFYGKQWKEKIVQFRHAT